MRQTATKRLHNKRILITAGPTMARIDNVRVISNTASGETGIILAQTLLKAGAEVTLAMGGNNLCRVPAKIRLVRFRYFEELKSALTDELAKKEYDVIIHSAAVSDYLPEKQAKRKISSGLKKLTLTLKPAPKLIDMIRRKAPRALLVGFKFEPDASAASLMREARLLGKRSHCDLVVANTVRKGRYSAFVVSPGGMVPEAGSKEELAGLLEMYLDTYFMKNPAGAKQCSCEACSATKRRRRR